MHSVIWALRLSRMVHRLADRWPPICFLLNTWDFLFLMLTQCLCIVVEGRLPSDSVYELYSNRKASLFYVCVSTKSFRVG